MALTEEQITAKNFKKFYELIKPYLNGGAHSGFTPVGSIIAVMGKTAPQNYLICDGTEYNIADYLELASYFNTQFNAINYFGGDGVTTFAVPDLRGEFLRGTGTNSHTDQGSGENVGEHQDATEFPAYCSEDRTLGMDNGYITNYDNRKDGTFTWANCAGTTNNGGGTGTYYTGRYASRPTNTSVLYCIAYKNIFADVANALDVQDGLTLNGNKLSADIMPQTDMSEVMSELPMAKTSLVMSPFSKTNMYSTDERVIGQWIDGKPVYQRTITDSLSSYTPSANTWGTIYTASWVSEIDTLIVGFIHTDGYTYSGCLFRTSTNNLQIHSRVSNDPLVSVTIQYTKTTDSAIGVGDINDYSTTEKVVGTWIDGKPVYQKTLTSLNVPITAHYWATIITDASWVPNIKDVLYSYAICSNYKLSINPIETFISGNDLQIQSAYGDRTIKTFIIQYTKTTD